MNHFFQAMPEVSIMARFSLHATGKDLDKDAAYFYLIEFYPGYDNNWRLIDDGVREILVRGHPTIGQKPPPLRYCCLEDLGQRGRSLDIRYRWLSKRYPKLR